MRSDHELRFPDVSSGPTHVNEARCTNGGTNRENLGSLVQQFMMDIGYLGSSSQLAKLVARSDNQCLHLVQAFDDGAKLLEAAARHGLEGIVSKRKASPYRSEPSSDWVKTKTAAWRMANRDRWRAFQQPR
jgi:hypothetical protein